MKTIFFLSGVRKSDAEIIAEVVQVVRTTVGPVASFKEAVIVKKLPKTRSGKIARNTVSAMISGKPYKVRYTEKINKSNSWPTLMEIIPENESVHFCRNHHKLISIMWKWISLRLKL